MPGVFSPSEISPSKQTPGSLGIKEVLSLRFRRKDEEQRGIKCLAGSLQGDELNQSCSELSAQCHSHRLLCHCLLQALPLALPTFLSFSHFSRSVFPCPGAPSPSRLGAQVWLSGGINFKFLSSALQLEMRKRQSKLSQLLAHGQQVWSSFWGSNCITIAAKICVILPCDLTRAHNTLSTQTLRLLPARGASNPPKHNENPMNKDVLPTMEQLCRSLFIPYTLTPSPCLHPRKETLISPGDEFVSAPH